jgi:hypothetical protein
MLIRSPSVAMRYRNCNCCHQLLACRHADLPRHLVPLPPDNPTGSKLREATDQRELQF